MSLKIIRVHLSPVSLFDLHACSENCIFLLSMLLQPHHAGYQLLHKEFEWLSELHYISLCRAIYVVT